MIITAKVAKESKRKKVERSEKVGWNSMDTFKAPIQTVVTQENNIEKA